LGRVFPSVAYSFRTHDESSAALEDYYASGESWSPVTSPKAAEKNVADFEP
jgi:hypothetical protein